MRVASAVQPVRRMIDMRGINLEISDALADHVERKLALALRRYRDRIGHVVVRLADLNGPRGGVDKRCAIVVGYVDGGTTVVHDDSDDIYTAVTRATTRLDEQIARRLRRDREADARG